MNLTQRVHDTSRLAEIAERVRAGGLARVQTRHVSKLLFQRGLDLSKCQTRERQRQISFSRFPAIRRLLQARRKRISNITTEEVAANA